MCNYIIHIQTLLYTDTYTRTHVPACTHMYTYVHTCTHMYTHVHTYTHIHIYTYTHMYTCTYTYTFAYTDTDTLNTTHYTLHVTRCTLHKLPIRRYILAHVRTCIQAYRHSLCCMVLPFLVLHAHIHDMCYKHGSPLDLLPEVKVGQG